MVLFGAWSVGPLVLDSTEHYRDIEIVWKRRRARHGLTVPADDLFESLDGFEPWWLDFPAELFTEAEIEQFSKWVKRVSGPDLDISAIELPLKDWSPAFCYSPHHGNVSFFRPAYDLPFEVYGTYSLQSWSRDPTIPPDSFDALIIHKPVSQSEIPALETPYTRAMVATWRGDSIFDTINEIVANGDEDENE